MNATLPPGQKAKARHEIQSVRDDLLLDAIFESLQLAGSYCESAMLACRRGDRHELSIRRRQISASLKAAFTAHTELLTGGAQ
jgi:hypothetical protein